ncbi:MAG: DNA polymerase III subunit delta [Brevefilum sp.]
MPEDKPIVYVLRGDDRQAIETHIATFIGALGDVNMAEMNTTRLDGSTTDLNALQSAALAMPFLAERRLVILEDALKPYIGPGKQAKRTKFLALLDELPASTALVLTVQDHQKYSRQTGPYWETLKPSHWFMKWAHTAGSRAIVIDCALPSAGNMPVWITNKAADLGGEFTRDAALILRDYIHNNTQHALQEINKLLAYVNYQRPVTAADVEFLTVQDRQSDIFAMVDAMGNRNGQQALELLHILLEEMDFIPLFGMVVRQFRLLIQAREILDLGGGEKNLTETLGLHPFVAKKIHIQAQQFDLPTLEGIYQHLLEIDLGEKTSRMPGEIALDMLIARLAGELPVQ